jgi:hypothetical protein
MAEFYNQHGFIRQGDWVTFEPLPEWKGETAGVFRHDGERFYVETINSGKAPLDQIRLETLKKS